MLNGWAPVAVGLLGAGISVAAAGQFDMKTLHETGTWEVLLTSDPAGGISWCSAATQNPALQWFSIVAYDSGEVALFVGDRSWELDREPVDFVVDIDHSRWSLGGESGGNSVSVFLDGSETAGAFLGELRASAEVSFFTAIGDPIATFPLAGAEDAFDVLVECSLTIARPSADSIPTVGESL